MEHFPSPKNDLESNQNKSEQKGYLAKIKKAARILTKSFVIGAGALTIGYGTAYQFREEYPSKTLHKVDKEKRVGFEKNTEKILSQIQEEFVYKMEDDRKKNKDTLSLEEKKIFEERFQNFVSEYLDGINIELIDKNTNIPFYYKLSGGNPPGYVYGDKIFFRPSKFFTQKDSLIHTHGDYDIFVAEAAHHINQDTRFLRYINIPMDIIENDFDQHKTYIKYNTLEYQAHSITERAIHAYLEQEPNKDEVSFEKIYTSSFDVHREIIDFFEKNEELFKTKEQKNFIITGISNWIRYKLLQEPSHIDVHKEDYLKQLDDSFVPFLHEIKKIEQENHLPFDFEERIVTEYFMQIFDTQEVFPEKMSPEEIQFFVDDYFIRNFSLRDNGLDDGIYGEALSIYKSKVIPHLESITSLDHLSEQYEKIAASYSSFYLISDVIKNKEFSNGEIIKIIPLVYQLYIQNNKVFFDDIYIPPNPEKMLEKYRKEIIRKIVNSDREDIMNILKSVSSKIKTINKNFLEKQKEQ